MCTMLRSLNIRLVISLSLALRGLAQSTIAILQTRNGESFAMALAISDTQTVLVLNNQGFPVATIDGSDTAIVNGQKVPILVAQFIQTPGAQENADIAALTSIRAGTGTQPVALKAEDILQLSAPQRKTVVNQLSQTQLQGLSSDQAEAFGLIGNQTQTRQNSSQPQQEGQQSNGSVVISDVIPIATKANATRGNSEATATSKPPAKGTPVVNATSPQNATAPRVNIATIVGTAGQAPPPANVPQQQSNPIQNQSPNAAGQPSQPNDQGSQAQNASQPENQQPGTKSSTTNSQVPDTTTEAPQPVPQPQSQKKPPVPTGTSIAVEAAEEGVIEAEQAVETASASSLDDAIAKLAQAQAKEKSAEEAEKVKRSFEISRDAVRRLFREGSERRGERWLTRLKSEREFVRVRWDDGKLTRIEELDKMRRDLEKVTSTKQHGVRYI